MKLGTDVSALAKRIGVHRSLLYQWRDQAERGEGPGPEVAAETPEEHKVAELRARLAEAEAAVGRQQLQLDFFQGALQRVEASRKLRSGGAKPSTPKSARSCKAS